MASPLSLSCGCGPVAAAATATAKPAGSDVCFAFADLHDMGRVEGERDGHGARESKSYCVLLVHWRLLMAAPAASRSSCAVAGCFLRPPSSTAAARLLFSCVTFSCAVAVGVAALDPPAERLDCTAGAQQLDAAHSSSQRTSRTR